MEKKNRTNFWYAYRLSSPRDGEWRDRKKPLRGTGVEKAATDRNALSQGDSDTWLSVLRIPVLGLQVTLYSLSLRNRLEFICFYRRNQPWIDQPRPCRSTPLGGTSQFVPRDWGGSSALGAHVGLRGRKKKTVRSVAWILPCSLPGWGLLLGLVLSLLCDPRLVSAHLCAAKSMEGLCSYGVDNFYDETDSFHLDVFAAAGSIFS
jgi:hypothetical protein